MTQSAKTEATTIASNLYEVVTNKIIAMIEQGVTPCRKPWSTYGLARNYITGRIYSGINFLIMNNTVHRIPFFLTYIQIKEQGGWIKKGAKSHQVIYFKLHYKDWNDTSLSKEEAKERSEKGEEIKFLKFIRHYNVNNVEDIDGIDFSVSSCSINSTSKG